MSPHTFLLIPGLGKKMEALAKEKDCQNIYAWIKSISNHLYWCAASSKSRDEIVAKWSSVINHIQNVHIHENPLFTVCLHEPSLSRDWLQPSILSNQNIFILQPFLNPI